jgi:hypothetical protein
MPSRLLEHEPRVHTLMPEQPLWGRNGDELEAAAAVLEQLESRELEAGLVRLIDDALAAQRRLARPRVHHLALVLGRVARRVLRRRDAPRVAAVGRLFNLELEGLSAEDQLFELARSFVRLSRAAAQRAALAPAGDTPALVAARATFAAARALAPGLAPMVALHGHAPAVTAFRPGRETFAPANPTPHRWPTAVA